MTGPPLTADEHALLDRIAEKVVRRGLTAPAILFLASLGPMSFVASQAMVFFAPLVGAVFDRRDYDVLQTVLERREGLELLLSRIEHRDAAHRGTTRPGQKASPGQDGSGASSGGDDSTASG